MYELNSFYINGEWCPASQRSMVDIVNPSNDKCLGHVALGNEDDVKLAVHAAKEAFKTFGLSDKKTRIDLLRKILEEYKSRYDDVAEAISLEMGAPISFSKKAQAYTGIEHFEATLKALEAQPEYQQYDGYRIYQEPIGVCGLITPWNWPINQISCKVAPALAMGCTVVLKPSEFAPLSAKLFADILHEAGVPKGVFNMLFGDGQTVGNAITAHPDVDMISFTGSTRAGVHVAKAAADTVKRVSQELGGKSPIILGPGQNNKDIMSAVLWLCMENSGQSCNAGTRLLVPAPEHDGIVSQLVDIAEVYKIADASLSDTDIGPLANKTQYDKVCALLEKAHNQGIEARIGGYEKLERQQPGYFVPPTIFADMNAEDFLVREEIFGPVLTIVPYDTFDEAIKMANDTEYGLSAYIYSDDDQHIKKAEREIRSGMIHINGAPLSANAPFGGFKKSGNGREWGTYGLHEFTEIKAVMTKA